MANTDFSVLLKAELDRAGIDTDLKKVQEIVKKYHLELTPDLQTASLKNQFKSVCKEMANDFNKAFNANVSGNDVFKVYENKARQLQQTIEKANKIQLLSNGGIKNDYATQLAVLEGKFSSIGLKEDEVKAKTSGVSKAFDELKKRLAQPFDESNYQEIITLNNNLQKEFIESSNEATRLNATMKMASDSSRLNNVKSWQTWADNNSKAMAKYGVRIKEIIAEMGDLNTAMTKVDSDKLVNEMKIFQNAARETGNIGMTTFDKLKKAWEKFGGWSLATGALTKLIQTGRQMYQAVYDIDTAMTNLYKVTDETDAKYNKFLNSACDNAQRLGRTVSSLVEQTANWSKLGYSLDESEKLAQISSIYANVGEVDDATAVSDMVTAMKAFNIESSNAITIVDKLNTLGNKYATSAADLGQGLSRSASAMATAGTNIDKTLAMLTGGAEITQSAEEFGNMLKIGSMRIRGMKGDLEALGEEVDENIESISKMQTQILNLTHGKVNIFDNNNEFRDYYDIMEDISSVYSELSSTEKASLSEILFGKQRGNQGAALIQAFQSGQIQKAYKDIQNSAGSAMQEQAKWMEGLEAKTAQFEAAFQSLSNTILDSDLLKRIVDFGTTGVKALEGFANVLDTINTLGGNINGTFGTLGSLSGLLMNRMGIGERTMFQW